MNIALLGSTGLIGSSILKNINPNYGITTYGRGSSCEKFLDLSKSESIKTLKLDNYDILIHAAGTTDEAFAKNPEKAFNQNTHCTALLMDLVMKSKIKKMVYFSTAHVYGSLEGVISEKTPTDPMSHYAIAHYAAEQIIKSSTIKSDINSLIIRPNAVFGIPTNIKSFTRWHLIPYSFPIEGLSKGKITLKSSGLQKRNFVSTLDLVKHTEFFLENPTLFDNFQTINPIGVDTMSIKEFANLCSETVSRLTDINCEVITPENETNAPTNEFEYTTLKPQYKCRESVASYLNDLVPILLNSNLLK